MSRRSGRSRQVSDDSGKPSDASDGDDEVTRCVCGLDELAAVDPALSSLLSHEYKIKVDSGLFIQCDQCLVWQHGYCVGLFISADVPDKYWCEQCKPDLHRLISVGGHVVRTLYRPVNDLRTALVEAATEKAEPRDRRRRRSPPSDADATRQARHERRHPDDAYDEQLQRALRESRGDAESTTEGEADAGGEAETEEPQRASRSSFSGPAQSSAQSSNQGSGQGSSSNSAPNSGVAGTGSGSGSAGSAGSRPEKRQHTDDLGRESNADEERRERTRPRARAKPKKPAARRAPPRSDAPVASPDELLSQLSRPRYVNERLTIYELRKRTGAILEWLGRTQMELEEEREAKVELGDAGVPPFDENLRLMASLTEKILAWEQRFGKYAP